MVAIHPTEHATPDNGPGPEWDRTSALLDRILSAPTEEHRGLLADFEEKHPDCAQQLAERYETLASLGFLDSDGDEPNADGGLGLTLPERIGEFTLRERLGSGGMGVVFRAHQESLGRDVALKLVRPELAFFDDQRRRFRREAKAVAHLDHPNIVPVFSVGEAGNIPYLAMQYVEGLSLAEILESVAKQPTSRDGRTLLHALQERFRATDQVAIAALTRGIDNTWSEIVAAIMLPIADAVAHAHARGIVHRDIKPSNVLVSSSGRPLLLDFGLAMLTGPDATITRSGAIMGSIPYMSPEQIRGSDVDHRSDVFALGSVLYEALTLKKAFESGNSESTMAAITTREPADLRSENPDIGSDLAAVVAKCLEKSPRHRYQSASDLASDLRAFLERRPVSAEHLTPPRRLLRFMRREPQKAWLYAGSMAALLATTGIGGYLWAQVDEIRAGREQLTAMALEEELSAGYVALFERDQPAARKHFVRALSIDASAPAALAGLSIMSDDSAVNPNTVLQATRPIDLFVQATDLIFAGPRGDRAGAEKAVELLQAAVLTSPRARPLYHGLLAKAAANAGELVIARTAASALRALWPDSPTAAYWAGYALLGFDPESASDALQRALELDPNHAAAHADLGAAMLQTGSGAAAIEHLQQAVAFEPDNCPAWISLGVAHHAEGDTDAALDALHRATRCTTPLPGAFYNLGIVLAGHDPEASINAFKETVEHSPDYADAWRNLGTMQLQAGTVEAALHSFGRLTTLRPESADAFRCQGAAFAASGDALASAKAYGRVIQLAPNDADAHAYLCLLLKNLGNTEALAAEQDRFAAMTGGTPK